MRERAGRDRRERSDYGELEMLVERGRALQSQAVFEAFARLLAGWRRVSGSNDVQRPAPAGDLSRTA